MTTAAHLTARDAAVGQDTAEHAALKVRSDLRQIRSLKGQYHKDKKVFDQNCATIYSINPKLRFREIITQSQLQGGEENSCSSL